MRAIFQIANSPLQFQLCGSRHYGDAKGEGSDYDFVIEETDSLGLGDKLVKAGWSMPWSKREPAYKDSNTMTLYQLGAVQIIIVKSVARRLEARRHIKERGLDRHDARHWQEFYDNHPL